MRLASLSFALAFVACASRSAGRGERERPSRPAARGTQERTSRSVARRGLEKTSIIAGREVVVWAPTTGAAPQPVVIFSHGFHGCAAQSRFLTEAIAGRGYWVLAPNHSDALCSEGGGIGRIAEPLQNPEQWTDATYADRGEDIRAILRALADSAGIPQRMDLHHLVLAGHSLGGYTVLALAGAWQSWKIPDVSAVLALSPYSQPFVVHGTLKNLGAPVMYQGGTHDFGITPFLRRPGGAFDASPAPKYYVEFTGAGHFAWTNLNRGTHTHSPVLTAVYRPLLARSVGRGVEANSSWHIRSATRALGRLAERITRTTQCQSIGNQQAIAPPSRRSGLTLRRSRPILGGS